VWSYLGGVVVMGFTLQGWKVSHNSDPLAVEKVMPAHLPPAGEGHRVVVWGRSTHEGLGEVRYRTGSAGQQGGGWEGQGDPTFFGYCLGGLSSRAQLCFDQSQ
jgi:hypothetical protein